MSTSPNTVPTKISAEIPAEQLPAWLQHVESTEGWLSLDEAKWLFELASRVETESIIEIGAFRGRSTVALSAGARDGIRVYSVEPHAEVWRGDRLAFAGPEDREAFYRSMLRSGAWRNVSLLNSTSQIVAPGWKEPVGMLWIDGDHSEAGVRADWHCWQPHLIDNAVVVFDDAHDPEIGPYQLIAELLASGTLEHLKNVGKTRSLIYRG